jgi:hypothetical protein
VLKNGDKMNDVRHEASRTFSTKSEKCLKDKINQLETNVRTNILETYGDLNEFEIGYQ